MAEAFDELADRFMSKEDRDQAKLRAREHMGEMLLIELRKLTGENQPAVAAALGIRQPSLSKWKDQSDLDISTLQRLVASLGGELEVIVRFPKGTVCINQFDGGKKVVRKRRTKSSAEPKVA